MTQSREHLLLHIPGPSPFTLLGRCLGSAAPQPGDWSHPGHLNITVHLSLLLLSRRKSPLGWVGGCCSPREAAQHRLVLVSLSQRGHGHQQPSHGTKKVLVCDLFLHSPG